MVVPVDVAGQPDDRDFEIVEILRGADHHPRCFQNAEDPFVLNEFASTGAVPVGRTGVVPPGIHDLPTVDAARGVGHSETRLDTGPERTIGGRRRPAVVEQQANLDLTVGDTR